MMCCRDDDIKVDSVSSSAAAADAIANSSIIVPSFDVDDTPVTFRTRPTRARLVSTMLRQRSMSQHIAGSRVPTHSTPAASRHISADALEPLASDKVMAESSREQTSPTAAQSTDQAFASVKTSEETTALSSSPHLEKPLIGRRSRSSITTTDAVESGSSSPLSEPALKTEDHQPVKIEPQTASPLPTFAPYLVKNSTEASPPQLSPTKAVSTAAALDSSAKLSECKVSETMTSQISPIARNNQTLLEHLKRPPSYPGVPSDTVDVKKLRTSPPLDSKSPTVTGLVRSSVGEVKTGQSFDRSSSLASSSLSVTLNPPSRQPLSVKMDAVNVGSTRLTSVGSDRAVSTKSSVISPRFVSPSLTVMIILLYYHNINTRFHVSWMSSQLCSSAHEKVTSVGPRGCKNRSNPLACWMSYKATKSGFVLLSSVTVSFGL